jgi:hypothetical protein
MTLGTFTDSSVYVKSGTYVAGLVHRPPVQFDHSLYCIVGNVSWVFTSWLVDEVGLTLANLEPKYPMDITNTMTTDRSLYLVLRPR